MNDQYYQRFKGVARATVIYVNEGDGKDLPITTIGYVLNDDGVILGAINPPEWLKGTLGVK